MALQTVSVPTQSEKMVVPKWRDKLKAAYNERAAEETPEALEEKRRKFNDRYGAAALIAARKDDKLLSFFLRSQYSEGLFYELEHGSLTKGFGSVRGGSSGKFFAWRSGDGYRRRDGKNFVPCSEAEAVSILRDVADALALAVKATEFFHIGAGDPQTRQAFARAMATESLAQPMGRNKPKIPLLHIGWVHKYLALLMGYLSYHHNEGQLRRHLRLLTSETPPQNRWECDFLWRELFQQDALFSDCHPALVMQASYDVLERERSYWRIGTREGAERIDRWPAMRDGGFVSVGWSQIGDMKARFDGAMREQATQELAAFLLPSVTNQNPTTAKNYANQWWDFYAGLQDGDIVAAMNGKRVLGIGFVRGDYEYQAEDIQQAHHRPVEWQWIGETDWENTPGYLTTLSRFTDKKEAVAFVEALLNDQVEEMNEGEEVPMTPPTLPEEPLNQILYGPPGTGKTYATITRAVEIVTGIKQSDILSAKREWDRLRVDGRIAFVTFHQSYGYEDFVEGIRPVMGDEAGETPRYEVSDGILKRLALSALGAALTVTLQPSRDEIPFALIWDALLAEVEEQPERRYGGTEGKSELAISVSQKRNLILINSLNPQPHKYYRTREDVETLFEAFRHQDGLSQADLRQTFGRFRFGFYALFRELKRIERELKEGGAGELPSITETDPQTKAHDYLRRGPASGYETLPAEQQPRFVLVMDEVNRGNISKIFGELITLIESDYRVGGDLALTVTLPVSQETWGLPSNLYLLGTMNTADKSIALVDVALRRRFEFAELMPNFDLCTDLTPEMRKILRTLNQRITLRKDRDHQIGHAFFIKVSDEASFGRVWQKKIIPLLQEYFYGDWDGLRYVLGESGDNGRFIVPISEPNEERGARNRWQWFHDAEKSLDIYEALRQNYKRAMNNGSDETQEINSEPTNPAIM